MLNLSENCMSQGQLVDAVCRQQNRFSQTLKRLNCRLNFWMVRHRQRKQLASLNEHLLEDIGLSREQVEREVSRSFWD
jgi:uncharacterized protein YjiS (DUF1127 family)